MAKREKQSLDVKDKKSFIGPFSLGDYLVAFYVSLEYRYPLHKVFQINQRLTDRNPIKF